MAKVKQLQCVVNNLYGNSLCGTISSFEDSVLLCRDLSSNKIKQIK